MDTLGTKGAPSKGSSKVLGALLRLYPIEHRQRYAREMESCYERDLEATGGGFGFWFGLIWDHLSAASSLRGRASGVWLRSCGRTLADDAREASRTLMRSPAFLTSTVLTLGLGVAGVTAAFSILDRVVLRPLPYPAADRLVVLGLRRADDPARSVPLTPPLVTGLMHYSGPAEAVAGVAQRRVIVGVPDDPARIQAVEVTEGFFPFFGAAIAFGRGFLESEHERESPAVVVLGHEFWATRFSSDPAAVGARLLIDDVPHQIVGVLHRSFVPPEAGFLAPADLWLPLRLDARSADARSFVVWTVARLRPGASTSALEAHVSRMVSDQGSDPGLSATMVNPEVSVERLHAVTIGQIGQSLRSALAAVALLLVIACVNVSGLLLIRVSERQRELAVRSALGAERVRLVRQLFAEGLCIALTAGAFGAGLAFLLVEGFHSISPGGIPRLAEVGLDARAVGVSVLSALAALALFGTLPTLRTLGSAGGPSVRWEARSTSSVRERRLRDLLVLSETALAVVLVVASGLLAHDLLRRSTADLGYQHEDLVAARVPYYDVLTRDERERVWPRLLSDVSTVPGVLSVALSSELPTVPSGIMEDVTLDGVAEPLSVSTVYVAGDYFGALGIPINDGRAFLDADLVGEPVAIVNQTFLRHYRPDSEGRPGWMITKAAQRYTVIGIAADIVPRPGAPPEPKIYLLAKGRNPSEALEIIARTDGDPLSAAPSIRRVVGMFDPELLVDVEIRTVDSLALAALVRPRFYAILFSGFASLALFLALVGVYGTTAYAARAHRREIAVRLTLGARRDQVILETVGHTLRTLVAGVVIGLAGAALLSHMLGTYLLRIQPRDVSTYALTGALVLIAGVIAALVPAGRVVSRFDLSQTLHEDG